VVLLRYVSDAFGAGDTRAGEREPGHVVSISRPHHTGPGGPDRAFGAGRHLCGDTVSHAHLPLAAVSVRDGPVRARRAVVPYGRVRATRRRRTGYFYVLDHVLTHGRR